MLRVAFGLWLVTALFVLHGTASHAYRSGIGQLDPIFNRMAPPAAEEPTSPPAVQPRGPASTAVSELRTLFTKEDLATDLGAPSALVAGPTAIPSLFLREDLRFIDGDLSPTIVTRVFDARAPPSLT